MTSRRFSRLAGFAVAAAFVGVACGTTSDSADTGADAAPAPAVSADGSTDGAPALLAFSSPLVGGGQLDSAELADKPTAYWFWSPT